MLHPQPTATLLLVCIPVDRLHLCLDFFLFCVVLTRTIGSGVEPSLKTVEQSSGKFEESQIWTWTVKIHGSVLDCWSKQHCAVVFFNKRGVDEL